MYCNGGINMKNGMNLTMLTDFYELTMSNGYFEHGLKDKIVCFDMFFRRVPDNGGYALMMGLEQLIDYIKNLRFDDEDIEYLRGRNLFSEKFLEYLKNFEFSKKAMEEITESFEVITVMYLESVHSVMYGDKESAADLQQYKKRIAKLEKNVRKNHKKRIKEGNCKPEFTNIFASIFHSMERLGENCGNITDSVAEDVYLKYLPER